VFSVINLFIIMIIIGVVVVTAGDWQIAAVRAYDGVREKLGNAEQFYSHLLQLPSYRLRVELMLFRSEL